jgi:tetratricopeptide (TPR) repeat protein
MAGRLPLCNKLPAILGLAAAFLVSCRKDPGYSGEEFESLARMDLIRGEYAQALEYAEKAIALNREERPGPLFLKGHILIAREEDEKALEFLAGLFAAHREEAGPEDIRAYMYLLARTGRAAEAAEMTDLFFEKGSYFPGLGFFASSIYEAAGEIGKAVLAAFLDYEYHSGFSGADEGTFLQNIGALEERLETRSLEEGGSGGNGEEAARPLRLLRSLYDPGTSVPADYEAPFFTGDYILCKKKIREGSLTDADFSRYLALEPYFRSFPSYYWNLWQGALLVNEKPPAEYLAALEKVIALDREGVYAKPAWGELTRFLGFEE